MFQSPEKMEDDPLPRSPQPLTLGKSKMSHRISPLETGDSDSLLFHEGRETSWHVTLAREDRCPGQGQRRPLSL